MLRAALPSSPSHCWPTVQVRMALPLSLLRDVTKGTLNDVWLRKKTCKHTYRGWLASSMFPLETVEELGDLRQGWNNSLPFPHPELNKVFLGSWEGSISVDCLLLSHCKQSTIITASMVKLSICSFFMETASHHSSGLVLDSVDRKGPHRASELESRGSHGPPWSCHPPQK